MKRFLLFIFLSFTINTANAQSWCSPGATWYTSVYSALWGYNGITEYKYTRDSLIQNKNCKIIKGTFSGRNVPDYGTLDDVYVPNFRTYYTYEDNGVVYLLSGTSFDTVVNFKAKIGDKWRALRCANDTTSSVYKVTDTSHILVNNVSLRNLKTYYNYTLTDTSGSHTYTVSQVFTERMLGGPINWEDLFGRECYHKINQGEAFGWTSFCGYRDEDLSTLPGSGGACRLTSISENAAMAMRIKMYPNPTAERLTVEIDRPTYILINTGTGTKIYENYFNAAAKFEINTQSLEAGIYFLEASTHSGRVHQKIIKE